MQPLGSSGRYRELAVIGQGGMATVKLAALPGPLGIQKLLVIKEALPHLASDPDFISMFVDEARLASRFDHPNLIQTYEVGESDRRFFIVMEYLDGQPMSALLSRRKRDVPLAVLVRVLTRVLAGLHYAHELTDIHDKPLHVVHRDVSPQNVFLCYGGAIKLADFGIAKVADAAVKTRAGTFKGKIAYASPEQVTGDAIDRRSDIFSVGVMLWEGLTRRRITEGLTDVAILQRRVAGTEPLVLTERPDAPPELVAICEKAMAVRAADRYATADEMRQALEDYLGKNTLTVTDAEVGALVTKTFEEERASVRKMIQARLASTTTDPEIFATPLRLHETSSPTNESSHAGQGSGSTNVETITAPVRPDAPLPSRRSSLVAGAVLLAAVVIVGVVASRRPEAPVPATSATMNPSAVRASTVDLFLAADPRSATLSLDGETLPANPFQGSRPADARAHTLTVSAAGFVTEERPLTFERDVHVELALRPSASASPPPSASAASAPHKPATPSQAATPGLRFQGTKVHALDNEDPYGGSK